MGEWAMAPHLSALRCRMQLLTPGITYFWHISASFQTCFCTLNSQSSTDVILSSLSYYDEYHFHFSQSPSHFSPTCHFCKSHHLLPSHSSSPITFPQIFIHLNKLIFCISLLSLHTYLTVSIQCRSPSSFACCLQRSF